MKVKHVMAGIALLGASWSASAVDFVEGFDNTAALPAAGWVQVNTGLPPTNPWFQGNSDAFAAQSGAADSYIGANYLSSSTGAIDNWLISPLLSLSPSSVLSFYTRTAGTEGFADLMQVMFSSGSSTDIASFVSVTLIGGMGTYPTDWTLFTLDLPDVASGRFAFRQLGTAEGSDYLGVDSVNVTNAIAPVPEPETYLMFAAGLAALAAFRRRRSAALTGASA